MIMKKISKNEFFNIINPLNVKTSVVGDFPYTMVFRCNNQIVAKSVDIRVGDSIKTEYYG